MHALVFSWFLTAASGSQLRQKSARVIYYLLRQEVMFSSAFVCLFVCKQHCAKLVNWFHKKTTVVEGDACHTEDFGVSRIKLQSD